MWIVYLIASGVIIYGITKWVLPKKEHDKLYELIEIQYTKGSDTRKVFDLINETRQAHDLPILKADGEMSILATRRNKEMIADDEVSHKGASDEIARVLLNGADKVSEIIGFKYKTPEACVRAWIKSERHGLQILDVDFDYCGVSVETNKKNEKFYCVLFGNE